MKTIHSISFSNSKIAMMLCLLLIGITTNVDASETITTQNLRITVTAVDHDIFHVVAAQIGSAPPPVSPYVVENTQFVGETDSKTATGILVATPSYMVVVNNDGSFVVSDKGKSELPSGQISNGDSSLAFSLSHAASDRLYGAGNAAENVAGSLMHPAGTQIVYNGVTRIPYLWSTGGWSVLIANDVAGTSWQDSNGTLNWSVPKPYLDAYITIAPNGYGLLNAYARLTGSAPMPPRWAFGFLLSRWGYVDAADIQDKWHQFRDRQIPVDAFIYDYDWFINDWQFNPTMFPDPKANLATMKAMGLHFVGIRKPRVYGANLDYASTQDWVINSPFGKDVRYDIPAASYWWWSKHIPLVNDGVAGWWNDEAEQTPDEFFNMTKTEWDGWRAMSDQRAWSINRSFAPGMQRFGTACWTGDIDSSWTAFANQPGTMLNWSLAGVPFVGQDTGGFQSTPTPELYARWIEESVFVPVMRAHGTHNSPRWPWAFGDDVLSAATKAIDLRYRLIPYFYTFAQQTSATGAPLMRPLFLEFPNDSKTFDMEDEWLVGNRLLAAPVLTQGGERDVYLPAGDWYDFNTNALVHGGTTQHIQAALDYIPAYVRAGSIIPLGPVIQSTSLGVEDPVDVRIYPGQDASFTLYEDDGSTYGYQQGRCSRIPMRWNEQSQTFSVGERIGSYPGMLKVRHLVVSLPNGAAKSVTYAGGALKVIFTSP